MSNRKIYHIKLTEKERVTFAQVAKDSLGKSDEKTAAQHIQTAARYLQNAADSAHYEYGDDTVTFFDDVDAYGDFLDEDVVYDTNELGDDLTSLHSAVQKMEDVLKKASK